MLPSLSVRSKRSGWSLLFRKMSKFTQFLMLVMSPGQKSIAAMIFPLFSIPGSIVLSVVSWTSSRSGQTFVELPNWLAHRLAEQSRPNSVEKKNAKHDSPPHRSHRPIYQSSGHSTFRLDRRYKYACMADYKLVIIEPPSEWTLIFQLIDKCTINVVLRAVYDSENPFIKQ